MLLILFSLVFDVHLHLCFGCPAATVIGYGRCTHSLSSCVRLGLGLGLGLGSVLILILSLSSPFPFPSRLQFVWNSVFVQFQLEIHDSRFACIYFDCNR